MPRPIKQLDGFYHIQGTKWRDLWGSRDQVFHKKAYKTTGGLTKTDLVKNDEGKIISKAKYITAKREQRLKKYGFGVKSKRFGYLDARYRNSKRYKDVSEKQSRKTRRQKH